MHLTVNPDRVVGKIKPMHAVCNAPIFGNSIHRPQLFRYLKEANIPYSRLHDTGGAYGAFVFVDIENVFRDMNADETDPANYDFAFTDWFLERLVENGTMPFYRLGTTIENNHMLKAYRIFPPKDNMKWARIAEGIIRHYTEGWANGYRYPIEYWEIWNEPDNEPEIKDNPMWKGTKEQYFEFYRDVANYLKSRFPHLKIGGYASCGFYKIAEIAANPNAHVSPRVDYFVEFFESFLKYISSPEGKAPFDFFSWHSYAGLEANAIFPDYVRGMLNRYGFENTEQICNEWNPGIERRGKADDAAIIAAQFIIWQHTDLAMAMYYDWTPTRSYCGAFDYEGNPLPAYYAFKAFGELYALGNEIETVPGGDGCYVLGARNGAEIKIMFANLTPRAKSVKVEGISLKGFYARAVTGRMKLKSINCITAAKDRIILPPCSVVVIGNEPVAE